MNLISSTFALSVSLTAAGVVTGVESPPSLMSPKDRAVEVAQIEADTRMALSHCRDVQAGEARAVCRAQARADERLAVALLDARYRGTVLAAKAVETTRGRTGQDMAAARRLAAT